MSHVRKNISPGPAGSVSKRVLFEGRIAYFPIFFHSDHLRYYIKEKIQYAPAGFRFSTTFWPLLAQLALVCPCPPILSCTWCETRTCWCLGRNGETTICFLSAKAKSCFSFFACSVLLSIFIFKLKNTIKNAL